MKIFVTVLRDKKEKEWIFERVSRWFLSSDNALLHMMLDERHIIIPLVKISMIEVHP